MKVEPYWVIEHSSRGVYMGDGKFSWSKLRSEGIHYYTIDEAQRAMGRINVKGTYIVEMRSNIGRINKSR